MKIQVGKESIEGDLSIPENAMGLVIFAHGSGSSRHSPRNQFIAKRLQYEKIATLLFDLLTPSEEALDDVTRELRFDIPFLAKRLLLATEHAEKQGSLKIAYFGASTGAAAALMAAADQSEIRSVVSRGGRPDLAGAALLHVKAATLLIVGSLDTEVIELNQKALQKLKCEKKMEIIEGASHLFEEPGTLERAAAFAASWFVSHFQTLE